MSEHTATGHQSLITVSITTVADTYSMYLLNTYCTQGFARGARKTGQRG